MIGSFSYHKSSNIFNFLFLFFKNHNLKSFHKSELATLCISVTWRSFDPVYKIRRKLAKLLSSIGKALFSERGHKLNN